MGNLMRRGRQRPMRSAVGWVLLVCVTSAHDGAPETLEGAGLFVHSRAVPLVHPSHHAKLAGSPGTVFAAKTLTSAEAANIDSAEAHAVAHEVRVYGKRAASSLQNEVQALDSSDVSANRLARRFVRVVRDLEVPAAEQLGENGESNPAANGIVKAAKELSKELKIQEQQDANRISADRVATRAAQRAAATAAFIAQLKAKETKDYKKMKADQVAIRASAAATTALSPHIGNSVKLPKSQALGTHKNNQNSITRKIKKGAKSAATHIILRNVQQSLPVLKDALQREIRLQKSEQVADRKIRKDADKGKASAWQHGVAKAAGQGAKMHHHDTALVDNLLNMEHAEQSILKDWMHIDWSKPDEATGMLGDSAPQAPAELASAQTAMEKEMERIENANNRGTQRGETKEKVRKQLSSKVANALAEMKMAGAEIESHEAHEVKANLKNLKHIPHILE